MGERQYIGIGVMAVTGTIQGTCNIQACIQTHFLDQENMVKANPKLTVAALATFFAVAVPVMQAQAISPASLMQDGDTAGTHFFKNYAVWQSPLTHSFGARFLAQGTPNHGLTL
ncbi:MAG: hypothetical protein ACXU9C_02890, partial [Xanthobacteraceae bacterium]